MDARSDAFGRVWMDERRDEMTHGEAWRELGVCVVLHGEAANYHGMASPL
jgi:hypothetical protein